MLRLMKTLRAASTLPPLGLLTSCFAFGGVDEYEPFPTTAGSGGGTMSSATTGAGGAGGASSTTTTGTTTTTTGATTTTTGTTTTGTTTTTTTTTGVGGAGAGGSSGCLTHFSEDFSDNSAGWTLGMEWQIGPAMVSSGQALGFPDPASDHSPTGDNGVAGAVIGGNATDGSHAFYQLTSPVIDLSGTTGSLKLSFWRWLNGCESNQSCRVEVFDGSGFDTIFSDADAVTDAAWTFVEYDVTAYMGAAFQFRFSHNGKGTLMSGWNVDDILVVECN